MKRYIFVLIFVFIILLSGCKVSGFDNGPSAINDMRELDRIIEVMLDEGNYDNDLKVPLNWTNVSFTYNNGVLLVRSVHFSVFTNFDGELYHYDSNGCSNEEGMLLCHANRNSDFDPEFAGYHIPKDDIKLTYAFELFTSVDPIGIVTELRREFTIPTSERILIFYYLIDVEGFNETADQYDNRVFYYDNEFHYDDLYIPNEMMIEIRVVFFNESGDETYIVYIEID